MTPEEKKRRKKLFIAILSTIAALGEATDKQIRNRQLKNNVTLTKTGHKTERKYSPNNPKNTAVTKNQNNQINDDKILLPPDTPLDWSPEDEDAIKENIEKIRRYHLEMTSNITTKQTVKPFHQKYGTIPPRRNTKHTFKDFIKKYEPVTIWEELDKERILTGKNISSQKGMVAILKGIDNIDELLSLPVENGDAKLPVQINGRRFRAGFHNTDQPMLGFNHMHIHQYIIELMKQAIYQARNRMTFMQDLRNQHRRSGLYKMGFLFAKTDYAGKVFSSVTQKGFRMCSMLRQGIYGIYRPFFHYLDIIYVLERLEAKWFDVNLLVDMINVNDQMVKEVIFKNKRLRTPRDLTRAFDAMFIE